MSDSLGSMMVGIGVDTSALASGFNQAKSMIGGFGGVAAGILVGVGAAVVGTGVAAVKMAGDFQTSMTSLVTGAGESSKNLGLVSSGILDMAGQVGESTKELDAGMYLVESAGQHGAQGLTTLKDAAEGAKVGAASLADVANGVTTEMTDYTSSHLTAAAATNTLIAAVSEGKTHMADLATAMSTILPTSAAMHVSLNDTAGALATMTGEGTNAAAAATYLRQLLSALENPASKAASALKSVGLTSAEVSGEMQKSLPDTLQMITDALSKKFPVGSAAYVAALSAIAGGTRQMQGILELTGSHIDVFKSNVLGIADAVKKGGDSILGWSAVQQDFNQKMDEAKGRVEALMIGIGSKLLPVVGHLLDAVSPVISAFDDWAIKGGGLDRIISTVSTDLGPLIGAFSGAGDTCSALGQIVSDVKGILGEADTIVQTITSNLIPFVQGMFDAADKSGVLQSVLQTVKDVLPDVDAFLVQVGSDLNQNLLPPIESLISNIGQTVVQFDNWLNQGGGAQVMLSELGSAIGTTTSILGGIITGISDFVGWMNKGGPGVDILITAVTILGAAFVALKVADTTAGFIQMFDKLNEGSGIVLNLAGKAFPNLKTQLDGIGKSSEQAATDVEAVGTAAETSAEETATASTEMEQDLGGIEEQALATETEVAAIGEGAITAEGEVATASTQMGASLGGIETQAASTSTGVETIGTAATTSEGEVATASTGIEASIGGIEAQAVTASAEITAIGPAATEAEAVAVPAFTGIGAAVTASIGPLIGLVVAGAAVNTWLANTSLQISESFGAWLAHVTGLAGDSTKVMEAAHKDISGSMSGMDKDVVGSLTDMQMKGYAATTGFTQGAIKILQKMGDEGTQIMASLDKSTQYYWDNIAATIANQSAAAAAAANQNFASIHHISAGILNKNFNDSSGLPGFASGGITPGGPIITSEGGPEIIAPPAGWHVYSHQQSMAMLAGSGGFGGTVDVRPQIYLDGQEMTNIVMRHATYQVRLANGGRR